MVTGLGLRATARELGISHVALLKAKKTGRVSELPAGGFDVESCRSALELNSHPIKSKSARAQSGAVSAVAPQADSAPVGGSIAEASRQLEWEKLREKKLSVDAKEGRLIELVPVNSWIAGMIIRARDELTRIAPEMRDKLAQESDPIKCEEIVADRVRQALEKLSTYSAIEHAIN